MTDPALQLAVATIAGFEGFSAKPYQDQAGVWTIGFGETYDLSGQPITAHTPPVTEADARTHLAVLVGSYLEKVRGMVHVPITDNQAASLASFSYNEGSAALRNSTTIMLPLNQGRIQEAADGFRAWICAGGHPNAGLRARREAERALFLTPSGTPQNPASVADLTPVEPPIQGSSVQGADDMSADELDDLYN